MVQYYTLQEAAAKLHVTPDQLKEMAKKNEVRAFQDRGNLRFRAQEIDELARIRGVGSEPELQFGDLKASEPKSGGPKTPRATKHVPAPTDQDFAIPSEEVPLGQDPTSAASASKNTPRTPGTRSPNPKRSSPKSPPPSPHPKPGSDSDVRLIGDSSELEFPIDSEVKIEKSPPPGPKTPGSSRKSKIEAAPDSGVRIVPLDEASDSDVKIVPDDADSKVPLGQSKSKTPSDSDIRLEGLQADSGKGKREDKGHVTEEIDLDAEELKAAREAAAQQKQKPKLRGSSAKLPTVSPFELSDPDVKLEEKPDSKSPKKRASRVEAEKKDDLDSSSDFELTPTKDLGSSPLELGSDENTPIKLDDDSDEEVGLGELTGPGSRKSGINLQEPVDSGISLEQGGSDEMDIEERVPPGSTPKPSAKVDSSSEFELSLDDSDAEEGDEGSSSSEFELTLDEPSSPTEEGTSSEFELSLDLEESSSEVVEGATGEQSDSEFELTIDEGGALEMDDSAALEEQDKDIFETDFEVPALDEESGSEAVALDEEGGDSSDFDLDVDEDVDTEHESGSEVVPLDEDLDALKPAPRKKKGGRTMVVEEEEAPGEFEDLVEETEPELEEEVEPELEEEEEEVAPARRSWGVFTPVCATVGTLIMFFVCLMSYEMVASMWGYHHSSKVSSLLVDPLARKLFDDGSFPKE